MIARVCFEADVEEVTDQRHRSYDGVECDVAKQSDNERPRQPVAHGDDDRIRGQPRAHRVTRTREETEQRVGAEPNADHRNLDCRVKDAREPADALYVSIELGFRHALLQAHAIEQRGVACVSLHPRKLRVHLEKHHGVCALTLGALEPVQPQRRVA